MRTSDDSDEVPAIAALALDSGTTGRGPVPAELAPKQGSFDDILTPHAGATLTLSGRGNPARDFCPFANSAAEAREAQDGSVCPFHQWAHTPPLAPNPTSSVAIRLYRDRHGDYDRTVDSARLLRAIGGGQRVLEMTTRFYALAFEDEHLREFFFYEDGAGAAGDRLGHWLVQFMGGEGNPWDDSGREGLRQATHHKAWHSSKRPQARLGRRFKLDDCRVWMRLMFWAGRQVGLMAHAGFAEWYVQFIAHFIAVYEVSAPKYATADAAWSLSQANVDAYVARGRLMADVIGILRG